MTASDVKPDVTDEQLARIPRIVDLDAHLVEPPDLWSSRLPAKYKEIGPRVEYLPMGKPRLDGGNYIEEPGTEGKPIAWWFYEDHKYSVKRLIAAAGFSADEISLDGVTMDEMRPGCWKPQDRIADMDLNGVEAQMCFPNYPRFCGQLFMRGKDKELSLLCVKAYNDFQVEEWAGESDGRLIPLCLIPLWDVGLAAEEVRRNAARGVKAVAFSEIPPYLGLPSIYSGYWDPFFQACDETGTVVCCHIGSGTKTPQTSPDAPEAVAGTIIFGNSVGAMADYLYSGIFARYPNLKVLFAEAQIGWIPYLLERIDDVWETHRGWSRSHEFTAERPSSYYYEHIFSTFFKDAIGIKMLAEVGESNAIFETDYPHQDGTWPYSREQAAEQFGHLRQDQIDKLARGNAIRLLELKL
ncbi:amidohydrolase family protein [Mycobacterium sp. 94-17]|uniref:amidohydrolase family protein n=1 Tax=Mycobacterium sp. 94-17 TaxID=2986147 RepID=UPI002D1F4433|nr:amidohydrolase family protein [Mycobacterium sp. 94-17]MEB4209757.1 amidohydrolase family protein [Mycobacterium sp. 94-17]